MGIGKSGNLALKHQANQISAPSGREGKSHSTDQGNSELRPMLLLRRRLKKSCRNPTVQIRAIPSFSSIFAISATSKSRRNPTVQIRAIPSLCFFCGLIGWYVESQSHSTDQGNSEDRMPVLLPTKTTYVAIPQYRSGQFRGNKPTTPASASNSVAIPQYRSGQFRGQTQPAQAERLPDGRNPTVQIRAIPSQRRYAPQVTLFTSQSHSTDQGNSEILVGIEDAPWPTLRVAIPQYRSGQFRDGKPMWWWGTAFMSQSHSTDQGNSEECSDTNTAIIANTSRNPTVQIRAIPSLNGILQNTNTASESQSHSTDQGNSELSFLEAQRLLDWLSQSHSTDQGNSELFIHFKFQKLDIRVAIPQYRSGQFRASLPNPLQLRRLRGLFFQPRWRRSFFLMVQRSFPRRNRAKPFILRGFHRSSNRCAKMANGRWHEFCLTWSLIFKERRRRGLW